MNDDILTVSAKLSPAQSLQIMALGVMLRDGDLELCGEDAGDVQMATELLIDVSQEIALQIGSGPN